MQNQSCPTEISSLIPLQSIEPINSIKKKTWHQVFRAQVMIAFGNYSLKVTYIFTIIGLTLYITVQVSLIPMIDPSDMQIQYASGPTAIEDQKKQKNSIPITQFSHNCFYCARCNLGYSCKNHIRPNNSTTDEQ